MSFPEFGEIIKEKPSVEFGDIIPEEFAPKELTPAEQIAKHVVRSGARVFETVGGLPGDILSLLASLGMKGRELVTGKEPISYEELQKRTIFPPTSAQLRELGKRRIGEELEPTTRAEAFADEAISDLASMLVSPIKGKLPFARTLGTVLGANLAKEGAVQIGAGEKAQAATKLGAMFLGGSMFRGKAKDFTKSLYKERNAAIPKGAITDASKLENTLLSVSKKLEKGIETPSKTALNKVVKGLQGKIKDGKIDIEELTEAKRNLNEILGDPEVRKYAQNLGGALSTGVEKSIEDYGKTNPSFLKKHKAANRAHAAIKSSEKINDLLNKKLTPKYKNIAIATGLIKAPVKGPAVLGAYYTGKMLTQIAKSPDLAKHYLNVINNAAKENMPAVLRNLEKLDKGLKEKGIDIETEPLEFEETEFTTKE